MFKDESANKQQAVRGVALFVIGLALFVTAHLATTGTVYPRTASLQKQVRGPRPKEVMKPVAQKKPRVEYTRFSHSTHVTNEKITCESCHRFPSRNWKDVRAGDQAFPDVTEYPEHKDCLGCHRQKFFARERPAPRICYNCHVNATPVETSRYPFPSLGEKFLSSAKATDFVSDFRVHFPHDKHLDVISKKPGAPSDESKLFVRASFGHLVVHPEDSDPKMCAVCHQTYQPQGTATDEFVTKPPKDLGDAPWLKKGTFKTRPTTHAACFTCHSQESELAPLPKNCDACHKLSAVNEASADFDPQLAKRIGIEDWLTLAAWGSRFSAGAFRHEAHTDLSCTKCHSATMNTVDVRTLKVPITSCGGAEGCHVTATTDDGGILNYEVEQRKTKANFACSKCHIVFGQKPVPPSHVEAVVKAAAK